MEKETPAAVTCGRKSDFITPQKCPLCNKTLSTIKTLQLHIRSHTKEKPFKCEHCDFRTALKQSYQRHVERRHGTSAREIGMKHKCELCPFRAFRPYALRHHMLIHAEGGNVFPCEFPGCDLKAKSLQILKEHHRRVHSHERPFACKMEGCEYRGKFIYDMTIHMRKHSSDRPFLCSEANCGFTAKAQSVLNAHMKKQHGNELYHCSNTDCAYQTRDPHLLNRHRLTHSDKEGFKCLIPFCTFRALYHWSSKVHVANHTKKPPIICDFPNCGFTALKMYRLKMHMKIHDQVRPFHCTLQGCKFQSKTRGNLKAHEKRHTKEAKLPCVIRGCTYLGRSKQVLNRHVRCHEMYPNLRACPQPSCSYIARDSKSFKKHQRIHDSSERRYACPLCGKFFRSKTQMDVHSFCHTKEKLFRCLYCDHGTYREPALKQHCKKVHPGQEFHSDWQRAAKVACKYCYFSGTAEAMLKHEITYHKQMFVNLEKIQIKFT